MILHFFRNIDSFCVVPNIWEKCLSAHVFMSHLIILLPYLTYFVVLVVTSGSTLANRHQAETFSDTLWFGLLCIDAMSNTKQPNWNLHIDLEETVLEKRRRQSRCDRVIKDNYFPTWQVSDLAHEIWWCHCCSSASRGSGGIWIYNLFKGKFFVVFPLPYSLSAHQETFQCLVHNNLCQAAVCQSFNMDSALFKSTVTGTQRQTQ